MGRKALTPISRIERHQMEQVKLYDTTLRDGMGGQGMSLSVGEKLKVVHALDALGVHFIEAGFPSSNPKEAELFERLAELDLSNATISAFGMTRRGGVAAAEDPALGTLVGSVAPVVCLVGKSWRLHLEKVIRVPEAENLAMIRDSVAFCRGSGKRVIFDAEHFFDGYRDDSNFALACVRAAAEAGAENVTLCDTNGGSLPGFVGEATAAAVEALGGKVEVGIHTHNDAECAVANSLAAVEAGARLAQGCVNGYGERCGNANLASILPALQLKMGFDVVSDEQLAGLTSTAHYLDELCNMTPNPDRAYVGRNAFAHKAGMHAAGVAADARTFEHLDPAEVGNERDILASELSGKATIRSQAERAGLDLDDRAAAHAVERLKEREHAGYHYEAAQASFELLLRREAGVYEPLFKLESFRVTTEKREGGRVETEATIRVVVDGERYVEVAEGNGPVNALDRALRAAIVGRHPHLAEIELTNYKVRILDESHGTGAVTRVLLDSSDHEREWGTIGVSENIIEASWEALVDSLEYAFQPRPDDAGGE
jgi:2-isopropylmalate synthase